jgi:hypothetical protein
VVAAGVGVDRRSAAELAHPDDERVVQPAAVLQVGQQRGERRVERLAERLDLVEVLGVRVPAVEAHFDEGHPALDQPAGEQAALAEAGAAVGVAEPGRLLVQAEAAAGLGVDHPLGLAVVGGVGPGRGAAVPLLEVPLQPGEQLPAGVLVRGGDRPGGLEVVDGQVGPGVRVVADTGHGHRGVLRAEEAGPDPAAEHAGVNGDVARQVVVRVAELLGDHRAEGRVIDRAAGQLAGVQQLRRPAVLALAGGHAADDAEVPGHRG